MESLSDKLVTHIAKINNITKSEAVKFINKCLKKISVQENISYNIIYKLFYTFSSLSKCLAKSCSTAELKECAELCHCVTFKGKCVPRYLPDAIEINNDPDKWIMNMKTKDLEDLAEYASYLYYNFDGGGLTDNAFDAIEYHLNKRLKTKGRKWEKIGATPIDKLKTKLPYPMASLDKVKPDNPALLTFIKKSMEYGMVWSEKLDGVSAMIVYKNGEIHKIYTRGDGIIGGDVTYLKDYIKFPKINTRYLVVRGEFILSKQNWSTKYFQSGYANPRSFVSAKINTGYITPELVDIQFLAYNIIDWDADIPKPSQAFKILVENGFNTPDNGIFQNNLLIFDIVNLYKEKRATSDYVIDGIVLSIDVPHPIEDLINPIYSKAFKMPLEEQMRKTKVVNVDWNITRYGRYFPVAVYESVYIDGVRLHRASAHNANHVIDWHLGKGTNIVITRSGDVIPVIKDVQVDENISPILPDNTYSWHWADKDIVLDDIENNEIVHVKRITHFFSTIGTPQLGPGRIAKLYANGFKTIKDFANAKEMDIIRIKGFGAKLSKILYSNIHNTMRKTRMDRYFIAMTTFKTSIGHSLFKQVLRYYPDILSHSSEEIKKHLIKNKIPGIGPKRIITLAESIPKFKEMLLDINKDDITFALNYDKDRLNNIKTFGYNPKIKDKIFVMTGFLDHPDYDLEDYIWDHWGNLSSTVTGNTTAVICANISNITGKMLKAMELGVSVYTIPEFIEEFNVPIKVKEQAEIIITDNLIE